MIHIITIIIVSLKYSEFWYHFCHISFHHLMKYFLTEPPILKYQTPLPLSSPPHLYMKKKSPPIEKNKAIIVRKLKEQKETIWRCISFMLHLMAHNVYFLHHPCWIFWNPVKICVLQTRIERPKHVCILRKRADMGSFFEHFKGTKIQMCLMKIVT